MITNAITLTILCVFALISLSTLLIVREKEVLLPWKVIFAAVFLILVQQSLVILRELGFYTRNLLVGGLLDIVIAALFIYAILLKIESVRA